MKDALKKPIKLVDEAHEIVGVGIFLLSTVLFHFDVLDNEQMVTGFALAASVYLGVRSMRGAVRKLVEMLREEKPKEDEGDGEEEPKEEA